jgi:hypothetical protein
VWNRLIKTQNQNIYTEHIFAVSLVASSRVRFYWLPPRLARRLPRYVRNPITRISCINNLAFTSGPGIAIPCSKNLLLASEKHSQICLRRPGDR